MIRSVRWVLLDSLVAYFLGKMLSARARRKACTADHKAGFRLIMRLAAKAVLNAAVARRPRNVSGRNVSNNGSGSRQKDDL